MAGKTSDFSQFEGPGAKYAPKAPKRPAKKAEDFQDMGHEVRDHSDETDQWGIPLFKRHESEAMDAAKEAEKYSR